MSSTTQATLELTVVNHWIGGKPYEGPTERWGDVFNPATGESNTRVAFATEDVVDQAVRAAAIAQKKWGAASLAQRARVMFASAPVMVKSGFESGAAKSQQWIVP